MLHFRLNQLVLPRQFLPVPRVPAIFGMCLFVPGNGVLHRADPGRERQCGIELAALFDPLEQLNGRRKLGLFQSQRICRIPQAF